ncbi:MAG: aquaporin [Firmicutes bacterium]|nr:aquaporin [Bacillota bacterium]
MEKCLIKKGVAEMIGTMVLVFIAVGVAVATGSLGFYFNPSVDLVATALAFGLVIVAMAYTIGRVSGCHINPAVSFGAFLSKRMSLKEFGVYVAFQFAGAILGAALLYTVVFLTGIDAASLAVWGTNGYVAAESTANGIIAALIIEIVLTCIFVYVILAVTSKKGDAKRAGIIIGLTLTLVHLIGINFTGTSVNPARSFGPALMALAFGGGSYALAEVWLFLAAPMAGALLAALLFKYLHAKEEESEISVKLEE